MKRIVIFALTAIATSPLAIATPVCTTGSLADYASLGVTGCTIGTSTLSNFTILPNILPGSFQINPSQINVVPLNGVGFVGLYLDLLSASRSQIIFNYQISGNTYTSDTLFIGQYSLSSNGVVYEAQSYCENGVFGPDGMTGCTGIPGSLSFFASPPFPIPPAPGVSLALPSTLSITTTYNLDSGFYDITTGGDFGNILGVPRGPVPEPINFLLTAVGLAIAAASRRIAKLRARPPSN